MRPERWIVVFGLLAASAGSQASLRAQEVGDDVVVANDKAQMLPRKGAAVPIAKGEILLVQRVEKDRFYARLAQGANGQLTGWIKRTDVLPFASALEALNDELKRKPTAAGYAVRACIWESKHDYAKAIADCDEAIRLDSTLAKAFFTRGMALHYKQQYDRAIADYTEAIRLDPDLASVYVRRALTWRAKGQHVKAMDDCTQALRINPSLAVAHAIRAAIWCARQEYGLAIAESNQAIQLDPDMPMAYAGRGYAWHLKEDYTKAIADYDQSIRLAPKAFATYLTRGAAFESTNDYDRALADYDAAVRFSNKEFTPLVARASLLSTCPDAKYRDGKKALKDAKLACELAEWKDGAGVAALAAAYAETGDFLNAVKWQQKAIDLAPEKQRQLRSVLLYRLDLYKEQHPYHAERN
jgi:tetratricopeptide (TPR) repeat protein